MRPLALHEARLLLSYFQVYPMLLQQPHLAQNAMVPLVRMENNFVRLSMKHPHYTPEAMIQPLRILLGKALLERSLYDVTVSADLNEDHTAIRFMVKPRPSIIVNMSWSDLPEADEVRLWERWQAGHVNYKDWGIT